MRELGIFICFSAQLNADNAAGYANKDPVPAELSDIIPGRKLAFILHGILGLIQALRPLIDPLLHAFTTEEKQGHEMDASHPSQYRINLSSRYTLPVISFSFSFH